MPKVEKNVPVPSDRKGLRYKYPFANMEVGDSVFFPDEPAGSASNPGVSAHVYAKRHGGKFTTRSENGGVRIWRVE